MGFSCSEDFDPLEQVKSSELLYVHPKTVSYQSDVGLFVNMLPFFEQNALYESIDKNVPSNSVPNKSKIEKSPSLLKCPSALDSELLVDLSDRFSGPSVEMPALQGAKNRYAPTLPPSSFPVINSSL